ncbi:MAG: thiol peroxidase [Bacteroidales bacterium]|nr:thiol peroxidase [Bacteroidales bacterium]
MAEITLKGNKINTIGSLPAAGSQIDFQLTANDLSTKTLADFKGQKVVLNIFPSLDTPTCAASVRRFNAEASKLDNTVVLCISKDLPFAQARFCGAEGLDKVHTLSDFRVGGFGKNYGVEIVDGPLAALHSRAVVILDEEGKVTYSQQVPEIVDEPDYEAALKAL